MMRKENSIAGTIDFFKSEDGTVTTHNTNHRLSHNPSDQTRTSSELIHYSITEALKDNSALRDRTIPFIDVLAARFSDEVLVGMPTGFNCIDSVQFEKWLNEQITALDKNASTRPSIPDHPLKIAPKLKNLSYGDSGNEVSFHYAGFICYREEQCTPPLFNIDQKLWPYRRVSMDWYTTNEAFCALAANILYAFACDQKPNTQAPPLDNPAFLSCAAFAEYFIEPIPLEGGHIPLQEIVLWLKTHGPN